MVVVMVVVVVLAIIIKIKILLHTLPNFCLFPGVMLTLPLLLWLLRLVTSVWWW